MNFKNSEELLKFFYGLTKELQDIFLNAYGLDGRPEVDNPKKIIILNLINKNQNTGVNEFVNDVLIFYPEMDKNDVAIYYDAFIAGIISLREFVKGKI